MKETSIANCYNTPDPSTEQFIPEHTFLCLISGSMIVYDGSREYTLKRGEYGIGRRNHLARYTKLPDNNGFRKIYISFDQEFLKSFAEKHPFLKDSQEVSETIFQLNPNHLIDNFIQSLLPYFDEKGIIDGDFLTLKKNELLLILLKTNPELAAVFFDFREPGKIDLEAFMNHNFRFNVKLDRFAYLTGRSLATFKRDFQKIFGTSPRHWLQQRRLEEAYFQITQHGKSGTDIYIEIGFENLSHFAHAFKKEFGITPAELRSRSL